MLDCLKRFWETNSVCKMADHKMIIYSLGSLKNIFLELNIGLESNMYVFVINVKFVYNGNVLLQRI